MKKHIKNILKEFAKKSDDMLDNVDIEDLPCLTIVDDGYSTYRVQSHDDFELAEEHVYRNGGVVINYKQVVQLGMIVQKFIKGKKINTEI